MSETLPDLKNAPIPGALRDNFTELTEPFGTPPARSIFSSAFWVRRIPERILVDIVRFAEILVLWISAYAVFDHVYGHASSSPSAGHFRAMVIVGTFCWVIVAQGAMRHSDSQLAGVKGILLVAVRWGGVVAALAGLGMLLTLQDKLFREALVWWFAGGALGLVVCRTAAAGYVALLLRRGLLCRRIVILGASGLGRQLARHIEQNAACNLSVSRLYDEAGAAASARAGADLSEGLAYIRDHDIDCVAIALPLAEEARIMQLVGELRQLPVDVYVTTTGLSFGQRSRSAPNIAGIPLIVGAERPLKEWRAVAKVIEDWTVALAALALFLPLLLLIALAIRLDSPGPVFFRQPRLGFNQKIFHVFKFRTMYVDVCDKLGDQLTRKGDARITRLGKFLRKSSLDELPQLLNVLAGDMSIVGPRPHPLNAKAADKRYDEVVAGYAARHRVKPGITGWAQVNGWRGQTDTYEKIEKRVEHDLTYIEHWSVLFDLRIILLTALCGFHHDNAF
jgi:Undecaprenyl-phosphate glucose phosphotransferase